MSAPWGLAPAEQATLEAVVETGCQKLAAQKRGVSVKTLQSQLNKAKQKSGLRFSLHVLIQFDRHMRKS